MDEASRDPLFGAMQRQIHDPFHHEPGIIPGKTMPAVIVRQAIGVLAARARSEGIVLDMGSDGPLVR